MRRTNPQPVPADAHGPRRQFLETAGGGFGMLALAALLGNEPAAASGLRTVPASPAPTTGGAVQVLHHPPRAKRVVQMFMAGAASHIDLWDHKPQLEKLHGQPADFGEHVEAFQNGLGPWMQSPFRFARRGECGKMLSDVVAPLGNCVDESHLFTTWSAKPACTPRRPICKRRDFSDQDFPGWAPGSAMAWAQSTRTCPHLSFCQTTAVCQQWPQELGLGLPAGFAQGFAGGPVA